jgi:hypothetical protein
MLSHGSGFAVLGSPRRELWIVLANELRRAFADWVMWVTQSLADLGHSGFGASLVGRHVAG